MISSGNFSEAVEHAISLRGSNLKLYNLVGRTVHALTEVQIPAGRILSTEAERVNLVKETFGIDERLADYTDFIPQAYSKACAEILSPQYDVVICPIGSGKLWLSLVKEIVRSKLSTRVVGITPRGKNGFYNEHLLNARHFDLVSIADKLTSPYTFLAKDVLNYTSKHLVVEASELELKRAYKKARKEGILCEPSGAAALVAYDARIQNQIGLSLQQNVLLVSTGEGFDYKMKRVQQLRTNQQKFTATLLAAAASFLLVLGGIGLDYTSSEINRRAILEDAFTYNEVRPVLQHIAQKKSISVSALTEEDISLAWTLYVMDSNGLDYVMYSKNPTQKRLYEEYAMGCKRHK